MMAISLIFKCLSTVFFFLAWWFYVPPSQDRSSDAVSLDETGTSSSASTPSVAPMAVDNMAFEES